MQLDATDADKKLEGLHRCPAKEKTRQPGTAQGAQAKAKGEAAQRDRRGEQVPGATECASQIPEEGQ